MIQEVDDSVLGLVAELRHLISSTTGVGEGGGGTVSDGWCWEEPLAEWNVGEGRVDKSHPGFKTRSGSNRYDLAASPTGHLGFARVGQGKNCACELAGGEI